MMLFSCLFEGFKEHWSCVWRWKHWSHGFSFSSCSWWWSPCHWVYNTFFFLFLFSSSFLFISKIKHLVNE